MKMENENTQSFYEKDNKSEDKYSQTDYGYEKFLNIAYRNDSPRPVTAGDKSVQNKVYGGSN